MADVRPELGGPDPRAESLQNIVTRLLAKKPAERYQSAREVLAALERIEGGETISRPVVSRPEAAALRRRLLAAAGVLVLLGLAVAGTVYGLRSRVPAHLVEADRALLALDFDRAEKLVAAVLAVDRKDERARELAETIARRAAGRRAFDEQHALAAALAHEGYLAEALAALRAARDLAVVDGAPVASEWATEAGPAGAPLAVLKGGSYRLAGSPDAFRAAHRSRPPPGRYEDAGVRLAADPPVPDLGEFEEKR